MAEFPHIQAQNARCNPSHEIVDDKAVSRTLSPSVPYRLQAKADAVQLSDLAALRNTNQDFYSYAQHVRSSVLKGRAPDSDTTEMDKKNMRLLCQVENARKPDLHLHYLDFSDNVSDKMLTYCGIKKIVDDCKPGRHRFIFQNGEGAHHHYIMADIQVRDNSKKHSIVLLDSTTQTYGALDETERAFKKTFRAPVRAVMNDVQASVTDCGMFALSHALKSKDSSYIQHLHDEIDGKTSSEIEDLDVPQLPAEFKKHTQSRSRTFSNPEEEQRLGTKRVNSTQHDNAETLSERLKSYRAEQSLKLDPDPNPMRRKKRLVPPYKAFVCKKSVVPLST